MTAYIFIFSLSPGTVKIEEILVTSPGILVLQFQKERVHRCWSYLLRHNLTAETLTQLLEMFYIMFPGMIPSSHYLLHKEFGRSSTFEVHFYCERCLKYLGIRADRPSQCDSCSTPFDADVNLKKGVCFLVLPLRGQIKQLLQEHSASLTDKARMLGILSDMQSGEEYQKSHTEWQRSSSKCCIWPVSGHWTATRCEEKSHLDVSVMVWAW